MNRIPSITIAPSGGTVHKNTEAYLELDLSSCGIPNDVHCLHWYESDGVIEFTDTRDNEVINELPDWVNNCIAVCDAKDYAEKNPLPPTPEQIAESNKFQAKILLQDSDWAALPDTNLQNQSEWDAYRTSLRVIFFDPPQEEITSWPVKPEAVWV
jgi:hypothetical protein